MKPFNLERALAGDAVITREGCKVSLISILILNKKIYGLIDNIDSTFYWNLDGNFCAGSSNKEDLFMFPKKIKMWVGISKVSSTLSSYEVTALSESKEMAGKYSDQVIEIEIEE
jgi:hypothetical protein